MKQLCTTLQTEFGDGVICTISPHSESIHIIPGHDETFFTGIQMTKIVKYCNGHNLGFFFECDNGRIVVYYSEVSKFTSNHL